MSRVAVKPEILRWARERADRSVESLRVRFPKYEQWERGEAVSTLKQLEAFAKTTYVPMGYLFLPQPPQVRRTWLVTRPGSRCRRSADSRRWA